MKDWFVYIKERFPIPVYALLIGGYLLSSTRFYGDSPSHMATSLTAIGLLLFFFELRLMDEYKDHEKDRIVHPERPIPRGLLSPERVRSAIAAIAVAMLAFSVVVGVLTHWIAGACYLWIAGHLWLMYKEFYVGHRLSDFPLTYAITHQLILVPVVSLGVLVSHPEAMFDPGLLALIYLTMGAFFAYEVCRKLDPESHLLNKTYLQFYGPVRTALIVWVLLGIAAYGAWRLNLMRLAGPIDLIFALSLLLPIYAPRKYKWTEGLSILTLTTHLWGVAIQRMTGWPT